MTKPYATLTKEKIDLSGLTAEEKGFLEGVLKAFKSAAAYPAFVNRVNAAGSAALGGGHWVTEAVACSLLYRVCQDLAYRRVSLRGFRLPGRTGPWDAW